MRTLLLAGISTLAFASPSLAQQASQPAAPQAAESPLDTLVPADDQPVEAAPKPTGDTVIDRLNALEQRVNQLEAENAKLRQQAELGEGRLETVETRAAKNAQFGWAPTIAD